MVSEIRDRIEEMRMTLACGHRQPVKPGNGTAWCPQCGDLQVVAEGS